MPISINIKHPNLGLSKGEKIVLDTNILLKVFFSFSEERDNTYRRIYQEFVNQCVTTKLKLYTTEFNIYEAFHIIDKTKLEIYNKLNNKNLTIKEFHQLESERLKVRKDMDIFLKCLKECVIILSNVSFETDWLNEYILSNNALDLYDFALIKISQANKITNIVTDDRDFVDDLELIKNFKLYSQNSQLLNACTDK